jgi:hypothetical protein
MSVENLVPEAFQGLQPHGGGDLTISKSIQTNAPIHKTLAASCTEAARHFEVLFPAFSKVWKIRGCTLKLSVYMAGSSTNHTCFPNFQIQIRSIFHHSRFHRICKTGPKLSIVAAPWAQGFDQCRKSCRDFVVKALFHRRSSLSSQTPQRCSPRSASTAQLPSTCGFTRLQVAWLRRRSSAST